VTRTVDPLEVDVGTVAVALDGSTFAERALPPAARLAAATGAPVHLLQVVDPADDAHAAAQYLAAVAAAAAATRPAWSVVRAEDAGDGLAAAIGFGDRVLGCLATHGRDRSAALLGSVATAVLEQVHEPLVLVGPAADPAAPGAGPVVAAVPTTDAPDDDDVVRAALGWAGTLGRPLEVVTVGGGVALRRALPRAVDGLDPALVVIGSHRRHGLRRLVTGDHSAELVHHVPAPTLVVPLGLRDLPG